jgi:hypothetical protein
VWADLNDVMYASFALFSIPSPMQRGFYFQYWPIRLINIGTNQYWRVLASIGDIYNICRSSWRPFKKFNLNILWAFI